MLKYNLNQYWIEIPRNFEKLGISSIVQVSFENLGTHLIMYICNTVYKDANLHNPRNRSELPEACPVSGRAGSPLKGHNKISTRIAHSLELQVTTPFDCT